MNVFECCYLINVLPWRCKTGFGTLETETVKTLFQHPVIGSPQEISILCATECCELLFLHNILNIPKFIDSVLAILMLTH